MNLFNLERSYCRYFYFLWNDICNFVVRDIFIVSLWFYMFNGLKKMDGNVYFI